MKRSQAFLLKAADALELPQELLSAVPRVTLEGDQLLSVENHGGVRRYTPECIEVHTALGVLQIEGQGLQIRAMDRSSLTVHGRVRSVGYQVVQKHEKNL